MAVYRRSGTLDKSLLQFYAKKNEKIKLHCFKTLNAIFHLRSRRRHYGTLRKHKNFVCFKALRHSKCFHNAVPIGQTKDMTSFRLTLFHGVLCKLGLIHSAAKPLIE